MIYENEYYEISTLERLRKCLDIMPFNEYIRRCMFGESVPSMPPTEVAFYDGEFFHFRDKKLPWYKVTHAYRLTWWTHGN
jgi:hypothetical protein